MNEMLDVCARILFEVGFSFEQRKIGSRDALIFEDTTVLGFILAYASASELIASWSEDANRAIAEYQLALRRAGQKAWNVYVVLLSFGESNLHEASSLAAIEENLVGTRKIARASVKQPEDVRAALLPLLPLQTAPRLEAVDIISEIRQRTTEIPPRAIEAILSKAEEASVLPVLEQPA